MQFAVQAFNVFNHVQLGDPGSPGSPALSLVYDPTATTTGFLTAPGGFGVINTTVNFNNNNDNKASPNTGTGLRGSFSSWFASGSDYGIVPSGKFQTLPVRLRRG